MKLVPKFVLWRMLGQRCRPRYSPRFGLGLRYGDKNFQSNSSWLTRIPHAFDKALTITPELKEMYDQDPDSRKIIEIPPPIEGCARHISVHACAIVISPTYYQRFFSHSNRDGGEKTYYQYERHAAEDVGLIKFDILGIRTFPFCVNQSSMSARQKVWI
jgi:DNA polymerase III alpha subunit